MTVVIAAPASPVLTLRVGYLRHLSTLNLGSRVLRERVQILDGFLRGHPDLAEWMVRPVSSRCAGLARTGAWPVVVYAVAQDGVRLDLEFAGAKKLTGLADGIEQRDPEGFARMRAAGIRLGWTPQWVETILGG
jgi:hypothetical protein